MVKGLALGGDLFNHKKWARISSTLRSESKGSKHMLKGEISPNFISDRPLGNLILSFLVISLWKTTTNPFFFDIFMLKQFPVQTTSLFHKQPTQQYSLKCVLHVLPAPHPLGGSSFTPSWNEFRISPDRRGQGRKRLPRGRGLSWTLCPSGHVPIRVQGSPKGEDYFSFVHAALQIPLDINVSWLVSVRLRLQHSAVRVFIFVELS